MTIIASPLETSTYNHALLPNGYGDGDPVRFSFDGSPLDTAVFSLRDQFVQNMGWADHETADRYDADTRTLNYATVHDEKIACAMRLTPVDSYDTALSIEMLQGNPEAAAAAAHYKDELDELARNGRVWDLTRAVNPLDGSVKPSKIMAGLCEMIGAGINDTVVDEDTTWIFTTTFLMKKALEHLGVQHELVAYGSLSEQDKENGIESYFCIAKPLAALKYVQDHPEYSFTRDHTEHGMKTASDK